MKMSRRQFLTKGATLFAALGLGVPTLFAHDGSVLASSAEPGEDAAGRVLVVIQLSGGNDGINMLVPYGMGGYYDARPTLKITDKDVLTLNNQMGLHPSLTHLHGLYKQNKLAIIQGVGYPKPDHSHFRSMEIWQTAEPDKRLTDGWIGRYIQTSLGQSMDPLKAIQIGGTANLAMGTVKSSAPVIQALDTYRIFDPKAPATDRNRLAKAFLEMYDPGRQSAMVKVSATKGKEAYESVEALQRLAGSYQSKVEYPNTPIARDLQLTVKLLAGKASTKVFYLQLGGFDDHAQEKEQHARVLKQLDEALGAYYADLEANGLANKVVTMAFSEFGRRVKENANGGTDHGTAGPVWVLGGQVKGGLYGAMPSLTKLDNGDLKYEVDFRSVYATLLDAWLKGDAQSALRGKYEVLPLFGQLSRT